ncbi:hypothetical protein Bca52824_088520 [Brassica carinata]|uniref:Secreted protein n=1 Tax=Brassica carinata TaxID=52824 RepID=A0A8X7PDT3_BRACI|nr:hypothetical protein Bca52824_088520 [Brassica carinata]
MFVDTCRHVGAQRSCFFLWRRFILLSLSRNFSACNGKGDSVSFGGSLTKRLRLSALLSSMENGVSVHRYSLSVALYGGNDRSLRWVGSNQKVNLMNRLLESSITTRKQRHTEGKIVGMSSE